MNKILSIAVILLNIWGISLSAAEINTGRLNNTAISGYDPVAYHLLGSPKKGSEDFTLNWRGAEWRFTSMEYLKLFQSDPEKYAPQYGGFCANGLSDGHKVRGNPKNWRIYDGKLFLFYSQNGRDSWDFDIEGKIQLASDYWRKVQFE